MLEFFQSVAKHYIDQSRAKDFILDLLRVDVPRLFVRSPDQISLSSQHSGEGATDILALPVPDEFSQFLTDYVQRNLLRDQLMDDIETIWVSNVGIVFQLLCIHTSIDTVAFEFLCTIQVLIL